MKKAMESDLWFSPRPAWGSVKMSLLVKSHILSPHGPACLVLLSPVGLRNSQKGGKMRGWTSDAKNEKLNLSFSTTLDQSPSPAGTGVK